MNTGYADSTLRMLAAWLSYAATLLYAGCDEAGKLPGVWEF